MYLSLQFGPIFTLEVAGKRLTFLTDPSDFKTFFQSPNVGFQEAFEGPVRKIGTCVHTHAYLLYAPILLRSWCASCKMFCPLFPLSLSSPLFAAGVSPESFWKYHLHLHDTIKHRLAPGFLIPFCSQLCKKFKEEIHKWISSGSSFSVHHVDVITKPVYFLASIVPVRL